MALSALPPLSSFGTYQPAMQPAKTSATQLQASFEKTFIDITTSDGDTVTLQRSTSHAALGQSGQWQNNISQGSSFNARIIDSHSFSYTVQGDLSPEELKDLGELFDTLSGIADDFYQGHLTDAVAGALNIGELGSLSSLSASFSKTEISASQMTSHQSYGPTDSAQDVSEENSLARHRQAQWQQILAYLEKRAQDQGHPEKKQRPEIKDHAQEIMTKISDTLEHHKRLAPLIHKLADKALSDRQRSQETNSHPQQPPSSQDKIGNEPAQMLGKAIRV